MMIFPDNHDMDRIFTQLNEGRHQNQNGFGVDSNFAENTTNLLWHRNFDGKHSKTRRSWFDKNRFSWWLAR